MYTLKSLAFINYLLSLFLNNNLLVLFLIINFILQFYQIITINNNLIKFDILIILLFFPLIYSLYFNNYILQFIMIFCIKIMLDFIWSENNTNISYDWIISMLNSCVLILSPALTVYFNFNIPIFQILLGSILISIGFVIPIAKYINFSDFEYPNLMSVYNYYTGLKLNPNFKLVYIIIHFIYELFFDKILEGAIFFIYYRELFKLYGFVPELIITNLVYSLSQTFSLYEDNNFRIKYFIVCSIVCAIFQYIFYYFNYNLIPVSIFHATIFMIQFFLFYKTSEVYIKTSVPN